MNDKILSLLGLCRRAGKLSAGNDPVVTSLEKNEAKLVICTSDISANTYKKILHTADKYNVQCLSLNRAKEKLGGAIGKYCAVVSINDAGFAKKLAGYIQTESEE